MATSMRSVSLAHLQRAGLANVAWVACPGAVQRFARFRRRIAP